MKKFYVILSFILLAVTAFALSDQPNGKTKQIVIYETSGHHTSHMVEELPTALYYESTRALTIEFPANAFEPYTLTVETVLTTQEYYVTTPFVSQYISPDVVNVNLYLETDGGDLYWGSFEATSNTSME